MTSSLFSVVLPVLVALVMFGLGLALTVADFTRVLTVPRAVLVTLLCQIVLLPLVCFGLVLVVGLEPDLAIGMMVLAAAPGGVMASVFSHLAGADVALNITVTGVNAVLAVVTLPVVVTLSVGYFAGEGATVGLQTAKLVQVSVLVLAPVVIGMVVRRRFPVFAERMQRPVRIASLIAVFLAICTAVLQQLDEFLFGLAGVGLLCLVFSVVSLSLGYAIPRLARIGHRQAVAAALEIGIHNAVVAITVAVTVLDNPTAAVAPAMYGALMFLPAGVFARLMARRAAHTARPT